MTASVDRKVWFSYGEGSGVAVVLEELVTVGGRTDSRSVLATGMEKTREAAVIEARNIIEQMEDPVDRSEFHHVLNVAVAEMSKHDEDQCEAIERRVADDGERISRFDQ